MQRKIKLLLLFISLSVCICLMSSTYSRYVASTTGDITASFSKWQIFVNTNDITSNTNSTISIAPEIITNGNTAEGTLAPSSTGYFDINIDPSNVDVSFKYIIALNNDNDLIPDLKVTKYSILPPSFDDETTLEYTELTDDYITNIMPFNNDSGTFKFQPFTIRIFFEWRENQEETMDDEADTNVGLLAADEDAKFKIDANISFEQVIN